MATIRTHLYMGCEVLIGAGIAPGLRHRATEVVLLQVQLVQALQARQPCRQRPRPADQSTWVRVHLCLQMHRLPVECRRCCLVQPSIACFLPLLLLLYMLMEVDLPARTDVCCSVLAVSKLGCELPPPPPPLLLLLLMCMCQLSLAISQQGCWEASADNSADGKHAGRTSSCSPGPAGAAAEAAGSCQEWDPAHMAAS